MAREGHVTLKQETRSARVILVHKPRRRWNGNIETDLTEFGFELEEWIHVSQKRGLRQDHVNMELKIRGALEMKLGTSLVRRLLILPELFQPMNSF